MISDFMPIAMSVVLMNYAEPERGQCIGYQLQRRFLPAAPNSEWPVGTSPARQFHNALLRRTYRIRNSSAQLLNRSCSMAVRIARIRS